jgi:stage II sporulation protein D
MTLERVPTALRSPLIVLLRLAGKSWWLSLLIWCAAIAPARAALDLRVAIENGVSKVTVGSSTQAIVRDSGGRTLGEISPMNAFVAESRQGAVALDRWQSGQLWIEPAKGGYVFIGDRWYRGRVLVVLTSKGLAAVNYVDLDQYLYSVLGGEMNGNWPQEALKAQAVAARSYALYQRQHSSNGIYDVGNTQAWQVYRGIKDESSGTQTAVNATVDQVLTYQGQIIEAVFHSSAGGCTENVEDVWMQALPYLRSVQDFDNSSPVAQWSLTFSRDELSKRIGVSNVLALEAGSNDLTRCGRIKTMHVIGSSGKEARTLSGEALRSALKLKSTLFEVIPLPASASGKDKSQSVPTAFQINGRGFGHGLGLSQWGAYALAQRGLNYQQILLHYYQHTALAKIQVQ